MPLGSPPPGMEEGSRGIRNVIRPKEATRYNGLSVGSPWMVPSDNPAPPTPARRGALGDDPGEGALRLAVPPGNPLPSGEQHCGASDDAGGQHGDGDPTHPHPGGGERRRLRIRGEPPQAEQDREEQGGGESDLEERGEEGEEEAPDERRRHPLRDHHVREPRESLEQDDDGEASHPDQERAGNFAEQIFPCDSHRVVSYFIIPRRRSPEPGGWDGRAEWMSSRGPGTFPRPGRLPCQSQISPGATRASGR